MTSEMRRVVHATPEQVWDVLADGWLYPLFVVGASRMRDVDDSWPSPSARLHHSVGCWPALVDDTTSVLECEPPKRLKLRARVWPAGAAEVTFELVEHPDGTEVTILEDASHGPARFIPGFVRVPMLDWRNSETLRRFAYVAERRH
ncbi:MAG TPA: SRPBCC family protein [Nocardioides sp.]|nr:SRPBCC family protein [Nocardioides sp.]